MYLHEYQSKEILKRHNILVPRSILVEDINTIQTIKSLFISDKLFLKAQIHSGSRANFGGIVLVNNDFNDLYSKLNEMLGSKIVTNQTCGEFKLVKKVLVEEFIDFSRSFYLSLFINRADENICFLFSNDSGGSIESSSGKKFFTLNIEPLFGISDYNVKYILKKLDLDVFLFNKMKVLLSSFLDIFISNDLVLLEINPLIIKNDDFLCLDAKFEVDDNSFFRQEDLFISNDVTQYDFLEVEAKKYNLSYISLEGNIGCIVNGAGLAMSTMDLINMKNGSPANFLDIGGDATEDRVFNAIRIILLNNRVNCVFFNIFGGIVKCDFIAHSIVKFIKLMKINIPIVVRFVGNKSDEAVLILSECKNNVFFESDFTTAVEKVVKISKELK
ncbi:ADP-forming succinate--CoA ligase subunit beta [Candidatus Azoamicus ciliaticola]|uniref:Succinate--CoA ligase [ADP-forming] subunit beta n=1 Tax=Candidatus Azoamicus ciliaticola TaxID=2652803 RepID=A0A6J5JYT4_9GAMM|nr:ADP-forming succinate--CoA ligase subunit beta [Candidatus Azoamicus ciliaticola]CAB3976503.1 Succinate--CoA ligase [ADP-forming] subunit beta [Candidatus Azoamicus ciliaticola]